VLICGIGGPSRRALRRRGRLTDVVDQLLAAAAGRTPRPFNRPLTAQDEP
jgi:hypothetical protein